jgi:hypothetical protein
MRGVSFFFFFYCFIRVDEKRRRRATTQNTEKNLIGSAEKDDGSVAVRFRRCLAKCLAESLRQLLVSPSTQLLTRWPVSGASNETQNIRRRDVVHVAVFVPELNIAT